MIKREDDGVWITLQETISVHHEEVFAAIPTAPGLTRWFSIGAALDLRQGRLIVLGLDQRQLLDQALELGDRLGVLPGLEGSDPGRVVGCCRGAQTCQQENRKGQ